MVLESYMHGDSVFLTLTYDDDHLPSERKKLKRDVQLFLKRLRAATGLKIRYFIALEYGRLGRAHFHGILYGISVFHAAAIDKAWGRGFIQVGECNEKTCRYVAKYVTKGDTRANSPEQQPTFSLQSRRPGIGAPAIRHVARRLSDYRQRAETPDKETGEIRVRETDGYLRIGNRKVPLGRFLDGKLRELDTAVAGLQRSGRYRDELRGRLHDISAMGVTAYAERRAARAEQHDRNAKKRFELAKAKEKI